jgi:ATP-dependent DNA helicase PIF1
MESFVNNQGFWVTKDNNNQPSHQDLQFLSDEQKDVLQQVSSGSNVLMHGPAGTGKSAAINRLMTMLNERKIRYALTAFTGAAAVNVGGQTIHSLFKGLGLMKDDTKVLFKKLKRQSTVMNHLKHLQVLIIDEISMVSSMFFDKIDQLFRLVTTKDLPFGGKQLILSGDFYQLPPIEQSPSGAQFAFESDVWDHLHIKTVTMKKVFRQVENAFIDVLNAVRVGVMDVSVMAVLCKRVDAVIGKDSDIVPTSLFATNRNADTINVEELKKIDEIGRVYDGKCTVTPNQNTSEVNAKDLYKMSMDIRKHCPAPETITLKIGAQVMLRRNLDLSCGLANGSRGIVVAMDASTNFMPRVKFLNGSSRIINPFPFEYKYPHGMIVMTQIPLILAWAMTIHKSQGCTLDLVSISTKNIFQDGQAYVALSRVRSLGGLSLRDFDPRVIKANLKVKERFPVESKPPVTLTSLMRDSSKMDETSLTDDEEDEGTPKPPKKTKRKCKNSAKKRSKKKQKNESPVK